MKNRPKKFFLYTDAPLRLVSRDWRPEPGDLSPMDLREVARLRLGDVALVGGGAGETFRVQRAV